MIVAYNALSVRPLVTDGAATFSINMLARLPAALPEARVVVFARADERRFSELDVGVRHLRLPGGAVGRIAVETVGLPRELRRLRPAVFVSPNESLPLSVPGRLVVVAQNLVYHGPRSDSFRGGTRGERMASSLQAAYYRARMRRAYGRADAVATVSAETARVLSERAGLPPAKASVVHGGSNSILLPDPPEGASREPNRLLTVSTLAPYKNLHRLVDVVALLRAEGRPVELDVVGGDWRGYRSVLERHIAAAGVEDAVRLCGDVTPERLAELYASCGLFLHLSSCESFGLPLLEAMRFGAPTVAANRSSLPEVTAGASRLVDPDALADVAAAVGELLDDAEARAALADRGAARAAELTWERSAARLAAVVRSVA